MNDDSPRRTSAAARRVARDDRIPSRRSARPLFRSYWMGGYEGADHVNSHGQETSVNVANGHWARLDEDYRLAAELGIRTVRESIGWRSSVDRFGRFDATRLLATARCARRHGLQVIWTLHHYGLPDGIDFFAIDFPERFADFCGQVARALDDLRGAAADADAEPVVFQPINEISFLSWALAHSVLMHPYRSAGPSRAGEAKRALVRATLLGCDAIWAVDPAARFVHNDPVIHVIATDAADDAARDEAIRLTGSQYEAWDMLCGRRDPELGGHPRYLDVIGINYYHGNQWELPGNDRLHWNVADARRVPLEALVADVHARYGRPIVIAETGHVGDGRSAWLDDVAEGAARCRALGLPLEGVCLYPLIDRPDWEDATHWHRSGLWDVGRPHRAGEMPLARRLSAPYAARLRHWIDAFDDPQRPPIALASMRRPRRIDPSQRDASGAAPCLVVFSHLRWDSVFQRPQQLLSRLSSRFRIVFVEEPVPLARRTTLERFRPLEHLEVLRAHVTGSAHGFDDEHVDGVRALLAGHLAAEGIDDCWTWFSTPMALPFAAGLAPTGIVYDCMDDLTTFQGAAPQLGERETTLLALADLVFTSGPGLFEAMRHRRAHIRCFPNSVDASHYATAPRAHDGMPHPAQAAIAGPRLGYAGVIDERFDLGLVTAVADARPDWQLVIVGPIVKIDPMTLPRRANIHWLGPCDHAELPALMAGWDVCLLPFAQNDATRLINPTKTLEYLAADRPVVSTPIADVMSSFGDVVTIAATADTFIGACAAAIDRSPEQRRIDTSAFAAHVARSSWDRTAREIGDLILQGAGRGTGDSDEPGDGPKDGSNNASNDAPPTADRDGTAFDRP